MTGGEPSRLGAIPSVQKGVLLVLVVAVVVANIDQPYPDLAPLQHAPTALLILVAPWLLRRWPMSTGSVVALWLFLLLHTLGGRYIYSYVPYDVWAKSLTGETVSGPLGWSRNHYDRLVHIAFGLLLTNPFAEIARRHGGMPRRVALLFGFALVGLGSALYETFEWLLTIVAAGDTADYYNGQQGDMWDAQKDMALALLGGLIAVAWAVLSRWRRT